MSYRTLEEMATALNVSVRWLREYVEARGIPVLRPSNRVIRFDQRAIDALEAAMRCPPPTAADQPGNVGRRAPAGPRVLSRDAEYGAALAATAPAVGRHTGRSAEIVALPRRTDP
jgi:hypothetical protein